MISYYDLFNIFPHYVCAMLNDGKIDENTIAEYMPQRTIETNAFLWPNPADKQKGTHYRRKDKLRNGGYSTMEEQTVQTIEQASTLKAYELFYTRAMAHPENPMYAEYRFTTWVTPPNGKVYSLTTGDGQATSDSFMTSPEDVLRVLFSSLIAQYTCSGYDMHFNDYWLNKAIDYYRTT